MSVTLRRTRFPNGNGTNGDIEKKKKGKTSWRFDYTEKELLFIDEYIISFTGTKSAIAAGYPARYSAQAAHGLLRKPKIVLGIIKRLAERTKRTEVKQDDVVRELANMAFFDIRSLFTADGNLKPISEMTEQEGKMIAGIEVEELFEGRGQDRERIGNLKKIKLWNKNMALQDLGKHLGMFIERFLGSLEVKHKGTLIVPGTMSQKDWQQMAISAMQEQKDEEKSFIGDDGVIDLAKLSETLYGQITNED